MGLGSWPPMSLTFGNRPKFPPMGDKPTVNLTFLPEVTHFRADRRAAQTCQDDQERDRSAIDATTVLLKVLTWDLDTEFRPSVYLENSFWLITRKG